MCIFLEYLYFYFFIYLFIKDDYLCKVGPLECGMKNITQIWKYYGNSRDRTKKREKKKTVSNVIRKKKDRQSQENSGGLLPASSKSEKPFK